ncbi:MAG TPA: flagellar type III secretion system pore protein FliP [Candidatus Eremiobacteraceae bacterium]|nr:flagellar type III secretion system pore protein FliP [Candidatus Eremiobacteraceae bacterium]
MTGLSHAVSVTSAGASPLDLLMVLFGLSLIPLLAVAATSFTRIIVVLGLVRASLGTPGLPPNSVIAALAIMLSVVIMSPTLTRIRVEVIAPYAQHRITTSTALQRGSDVLKRFMLRQTRAADIRVFERYARGGSAGGAEDQDVRRNPPLSVVAPAFMVSELRAAFAMGFAFALPFAAIDIVVAAVMMSLGMFMVSPTTIALPLKLLLFIASDGWSVVCGALIQSFR